MKIRGFWVVQLNRLVLVQLLQVLGTFLVDCRITKSAFFTNPCGRYVPRIDDPYTVVAGRSKVFCVVKCSVDPGCLQVEFREPEMCLLSNSSGTVCTSTNFTAGRYFYMKNAPCSNQQTISEEVSTSTVENLTTSCQHPSSAQTTQRPVSSPTLTSCSDGWLTHNKSCYLFENATLTRSDAKLYCEGHSAHLASLNDDAEKVFIQNAIDPSPQLTSYHLLWTSGAGIPGNYLWDDGSGDAMTLNDGWYTGQPDFGAYTDDANMEFYIALQYKFGFWGFNDMADYKPLQPVCEYEL